MKKRKVHVIVQQADGSKRVHTLQPIKYSIRAGAKLFSLIFELFNGSKLSSNMKNNIVLDTWHGDIVLYHWIKAQDVWIAGVEFMCKRKSDRAHMLMDQKQNVM